ncbi:MAG: hypothetical protein E6G66_03480 [Actinobacteria bacterium]|nr:MAG: hypothetical protein E6G66_03480 [Actinomycetota bacterium]
MIPWMTAKLAEIRQLIQGGLVVAAVLFIAHVWWKTKALIPTLGAMLLAGMVLWGTANIQWFQDEIGKEMHSLGTAAPAIPGPRPE